MSQSKQIIVWRKDLKVRLGKKMAMACHGSLAEILARMSRSEDGDNVTLTLSYNKNDEVGQWLEGRFTKIVCYVENEAELLALYATLTANHIPVSLITDVGLTEFNGVPTNTCIGIGPVLAEVVDPFTKHLPLL